MARVNDEDMRLQDRQDAQQRIQWIGLTLCPGKPIKTQIKAAASSLGWKPSRAREIWYGNARRIGAWEIKALQDWRR